MDKGKVKSILMFPPVLGFITGLLLGGFIIVFTYVTKEIFDPLFIAGISVPMDLFALIFDILNVWHGGPYFIPLLILLSLGWYGQYGFYSGLLYLHFRRKFKRKVAVVLLGTLLVISFVIIYAFNKATLFI